GTGYAHDRRAGERDQQDGGRHWNRRFSQYGAGQQSRRISAARDCDGDAGASDPCARRAAACPNEAETSASDDRESFPINERRGGVGARRSVGTEEPKPEAAATEPD